MKLNPVYTGVALGLVALAVTDYVVVARTERKKRANIKAKMAEDIAAIWAGHDAIIEKLHSGEYLPKNTTELLNDMKFEQIVAYNKNK